MKNDLRLFVALFTLALAQPISAQNLVSNGEFHTNVDGWAPFGSSGDVTISHDSSDRNDDPESGSLLAVNDAASNFNQSVVHCVESIADLTNYDLSGWIKVPAVQPGVGSARIHSYWYTNTDCSGIQSVAMTTSTVASSDGFVQLSAPTLMAPAGTQSIWLALNVNKTSVTPGSFSAFFDGIDLRRSPEIFSDDFELGNTDSWTGSGSGTSKHSS